MPSSKDWGSTSILVASEAIPALRNANRTISPLVSGFVIVSPFPFFRFLGFLWCLYFVNRRHKAPFFELREIPCHYHRLDIPCCIIRPGKNTFSFHFHLDKKGTKAPTSS
ncbi:P26 [Hamiltonella phage APSE-1]|uniref:Putative protein p26 n=1 Tax=Acyrthosiphon pisum secondary endosymbiont phage 1 TaxID=2682836 RepID=VP26_BPAPS|nr:hypothetical protein APSE-1_26 [Hamiltonella phage APSE-1]Q9T1S2.1 RecName: Full=Putative protein p26 [Hamiltonella phage APSE-1]AAF03969.1 P26 [Hamiltonella phage APSE-1]